VTEPRGSDGTVIVIDDPGRRARVVPQTASGAVAAGRAGAPIVLLALATVPAPTLAEVRRLDPAALVILGGLRSVPSGAVGILDTP